MPHKFNSDRRDKIPKQRHRVTNWAEYNEGLRQRGDLTIWIREEALSLWSAPRRTTRGGQPRYSALAIEMCLTLGLVFKQPLRQTQGLMRCIARLLDVEIVVPDFSTLSRRGNGLALRPKPMIDNKTAIHLVVPSRRDSSPARQGTVPVSRSLVRATGSKKSIKPSVNGALGASCTLVLTLSAARSFAPN